MLKAGDKIQTYYSDYHCLNINKAVPRMKLNTLPMLTRKLFIQL